MYITVQNTGGSSLGPYDIYFDAVSPALLVASGVSLATLDAGLDLTLPDTATTLHVVNTRSGCGSQVQVLPLPTPTTPLVFRNITVSARLGSATTLPTTASVYYKIGAGAPIYLGDFDSSTCTTFPIIAVPNNQVISLGILSGSDSISFGGSGSNFLCSNPAASTNFCGLSIPYAQTVTATGDIALQAKVVAGVIQTCGAPPPPPPPPPIDPGSTSLRVSLDGIYGVTMVVTRTRNNNPLQIYSQTNNFAPEIEFSGTSLPNLLPGDTVTISVISVEQPAQIIQLVVTDLSNPSSPVTLYQSRRQTNDSFTWTIPLNTDTVYRVIGGSNP